MTAPRLAVQMRGPQTGYLGQPLTYQVAIANNGDAPARDLALEIGGVDRSAVASIAPAGAGGGQAQVAVARQIPEQQGPAALGTLAPGQSQTYDVTVQPSQAGPLNLTANARARCAEAVAASAQTRVQTIPALLLEVVDQADPVRIGASTVYTITVRNQGTGDDRNVQITATLPPGETYVRSSGPTQPQVNGQTLTFAPVNTLPARQTITWQVEAKAQQPGDVRFRVDLTSQSLTQPATETEATRLY